MYPDIILVSLFWGLYFFLHSFLAAKRTKSWFNKKFSNQYKYYRLVYTTISILGLVPILFLLASTPSNFLLERTMVLKYVGLMLATFGVFVLKAAFRNYDTKEFMGIGLQESEPKFIRQGLLNYIRHPIYTGTILLVLGFWLFIPNILNLTTVVCFFIYLAIGIHLEEKKLIIEFGEDYIRFKEEVPMLIPKFSALFGKKGIT